MAENVLIVPRVELFDRGRDDFQGFLLHSQAPDFGARIARWPSFLPRDQVEEDPSLQQIIPYGIVTSPTVDGEIEVFLMRRTKGGGEARLHDLLSVGVGGHINPVDEAEDAAAGVDPRSPSIFVDVVDAALHREIHEELDIDTEYSIEVLGFINDDSNPVGSVHFGVVYAVRAREPKVRVREVEALEGGFVPAAELRGHAGSMETWSQLVVGTLDFEAAR